MAVFLFYPFVMNIPNSFSDIPNPGSSSRGIPNPWFANYRRLVTAIRMPEMDGARPQ